MIRFERVERIGEGGGGKTFLKKGLPSPPLPKPHLSLSKDF